MIFKVCKKNSRRVKTSVSTEVDYQFRGRKTSVKKKLTEVEISAMKIFVLGGIEISVFREKRKKKFRSINKTEENGKNSAEFRLKM